jgi:hypothetical protein
MTVFLIFTALLVYVLSSWWNWFYGDGFGMRPMVDFYAIFALVIALMFIQLNRVLKIAAVTFILFSTALNLLQTYQFSKGILHADAMDYNSYRYTFLKTDDACINSIGDADESYFGSLDTNPVITAFQDFEMDRPGWIKLKDASDGNAFSGHRLYAFDSTTVFSYGYSLEIPDNLRERNDLYVRFSVQLFEPYPDAAKGSFFVSDIQDPGGHSLYLRNFRLKRIPAEDEGKWNNTSVGFRLPALKADASAIRFYVLNTEGGAFYIDDMKITVSRII